ncbi:hypothetical protein [Gimesia algae]|uniref:Uncharacterized protein n=1 Tax=Gimesia algae TaxID=2527971 RepID=A0A517VET7_9PLAN|nr:hypothetical protein [Gimesia algae]QDT91506.1 hypothetical protein Pan161_31640 [Gimesia algae]
MPVSDFFPFIFMVSAAYLTTPAHGTDVFGTYWNCYCSQCASRRRVVHRLVDLFSQIPSRWIEELSEHRSEWLPLPMWGTLFVPKDSADIRNIEKLTKSIEDDDEESISFRDAGWQAVAATGIYAIEFDEELLLGIHGAGYNFYVQHWSKLYDALDYRWHESI